MFFNSSSPSPSLFPDINWISFTIYLRLHYSTHTMILIITPYSIPVPTHTISVPMPPKNKRYAFITRQSARTVQFLIPHIISDTASREEAHGSSRPRGEGTASLNVRDHQVNLFRCSNLYIIISLFLTITRFTFLFRKRRSGSIIACATVTEI